MANSAPDPSAATDDIQELLRSRSYLVILVFSALIGVPVALVAYWFLAWVGDVQEWVFSSLPDVLGFDASPRWWVLPVLVVAGLVVALAIDRLPGRGGHVPADGFKGTGAPPARELPGVVVASFVTLAFGVVLGPEAPLIAIGGGLATLAVHAVARNAPARAAIVVGAAGSFAAVSTLLGSPLLGAFLLMEVAGLAGPMLGVVLVPGLLAAGIGTLVFIGLGRFTGLGTFSLAIPDIPPFEDVTGGQFLWAIAIGLIAAVVGSGISHGARALVPIVDRRRLIVTPLLGVAIALAAILFDTVTDRGVEQVLFSGEDALAPLIQDASGWTVGALVLLMVCKAVAYGVSLAGFRGGPTFPAMFIGAALGLALSHLPGLPPIAGIGMGIGAMAVTMLGLPLTSVLLTAVFLQDDGLSLLPLVIVSVVVAYVARARLAPRPLPEPTAPASAATQ